jgi:hypothetical protein
LDENMNNAWFPGPVGSLRWEEGALVATTTPEGTMRQVNPEEGVEDGVWRDRYVEQWKGEGGERLKMRSVTFRIPGTFERGEGVEVVSTPHPPAVGVAAPPVGAAQPVQVGLAAAPAPPTPPPPTNASEAPRIVARLDNPNLPLPDAVPSSTSFPSQRAQRKAVPPSMHVYETYDSSGVREGVHERMERAKGEACRGLRRHKVSGRVKPYAYPHPGCLKCRERERAVREYRDSVKGERRERRREREEARVVRELRERRVALMGRAREVDEMFRSVGLGGILGAEDEDGDEDEEMRVEEFGLDGDDDDVEMGEGEEEWETESETEAGEGERKDGWCGCGMCKDSGDEHSDCDASDHEGDSDDSDNAFSDISDDEDDLDLSDSTTLLSTIPPCTSSSCPSDTIITGSMDERHSEAWGNFAYYGRVRPWDGLVGILRIGTRDENAGNRFFFYGYVYGGRNFVGNWRYAGADAVSAGMESSFVLTRRGEV